MADTQHILQEFEENGFVVIPGILSEEEIEECLHDIWNHESIFGTLGINRTSPETWENENWPGGSHGFINPTNDFNIPSVHKIRQNPTIIKIFQAILGKKELNVSIDRYGVLRPTKNIQFSNGELKDKPEWKTVEKWLHWDQNPWSEPEFCRVQGLVTLTEHTDSSGGFSCVPKFQKEFKKWGEEHPEGSIEGMSRSQTPFFIPENDAVQKRVTPICMPAGCLLIWDSRLPHQNYPNNNHQFRIVQYLTYFPVSQEQKAQEDKRKKLINKIETGIGGDVFPNILTPLGRCVYGLMDWCDIDNLEKINETTIYTPKNVVGLDLIEKAQKLEAEGEFMGAMNLYRQAFKLNPDLENLFVPSD